MKVAFCFPIPSNMACRYHCVVVFHCRTLASHHRVTLFRQTASPNGMSGIGRLNGVPMVAQEPVRHESQMQANPVEVQSYQQPPPWKALSDFALQSDIEQPAFQQLVSHFLLSSTFLIFDPCIRGW